MSLQRLWKKTCDLANTGYDLAMLRKYTCNSLHVHTCMLLQANRPHACEHILTAWHTWCHMAEFSFLVLIFMRLISQFCGNMLITSSSSFFLTVCAPVRRTLASFAAEDGGDAVSTSVTQIYWKNYYILNYFSFII